MIVGCSAVAFVVNTTDVEFVGRVCSTLVKSFERGARSSWVGAVFVAPIWVKNWSLPGANCNGVMLSESLEVGPEKALCFRQLLLQKLPQDYPMGCIGVL